MTFLWTEWIWAAIIDIRKQLFYLLGSFYKFRQSPPPNYFCLKWNIYIYYKILPFLFLKITMFFETKFLIFFFLQNLSNLLFKITTFTIYIFLLLNLPELCFCIVSAQFQMLLLFDSWMSDSSDWWSSESASVLRNNPGQTSGLQSLYLYKNIPETLRKLHGKYFE